MDPLEQAKKLREEYERALDAAESRRAAYHQAVLDLHQGGTPLREIAKELGLSHQRVHQIVSGEPPAGRSKLPRAAGGAAGIALILAAATFGALRLAHVTPFVSGAGVPSRVSVPYVVNEPESVAVRQVADAGLHVRVFYRVHNAAVGSPNLVYAQSGTAGERVAKGSLVTLYVATQRRVVIRPGRVLVAFRGFGGIRHPPGGALLSRKREVATSATPVGLASLWVAPDRVSRGSRCSWLQVGRAVYGGSCYRAPRRGLPEVVPLSLMIKGRPLHLIWGRTSTKVVRLNLIFRNGSRTSLTHTDEVFLYTIPASRWHNATQPASLVARDKHNHVVDRRSLPLFFK